MNCNAKKKKKEKEKKQTVKISIGSLLKKGIIQLMKDSLEISQPWEE